MNRSYYACAECRTQTYPQSISDDEKAVRKARGEKRAAGRGLCVNCYVRFRKAGRLGEHAMSRGVAAGETDLLAEGCVRCGIKHRTGDPLCQDCTSVVNALDELDRWSA